MRCERPRSKIARPSIYYRCFHADLAGGPGPCTRIGTLGRMSSSIRRTLPTAVSVPDDAFGATNQSFVICLGGAFEDIVLAWIAHTSPMMGHALSTGGFTSSLRDDVDEPYDRYQEQPPLAQSITHRTNCLRGLKVSYTMTRKCWHHMSHHSIAR